MDTNLLETNLIIPINKPTGMTSKDVSRSILKKVGKIKIGHVGTLDPMAEGVLVVLLGKATRLQDLLVGGRKEYVFDITFGYETDTLDQEGEVVHETKVKPEDREELKKVVHQLEGRFSQTPPLYSAVKMNGVPLYKYARNGIELPKPLESMAKVIEVYSASVVDFIPGGKATIAVEVSKGAYVRELAQRISRSLGSLGTVTSLKRVHSSSISIEDCYDLKYVLNELDRGKGLEAFSYPIEKLLLPCPIIEIVDDQTVEKLQFGQKVTLSQSLVPYDFISLACNADVDVECVLKTPSGKLFSLGRVKKSFEDTQFDVVAKRRLI